jgi:uncharacterized protein YjbI with pentapeptide repeats
MEGVKFIMEVNHSERSKVLELLTNAKNLNEAVDGLDLSDQDLTFSDLSEVIVDGTLAKRIKLRASSLTRASFLDCDFESADFSNCNLEESDIADCVLSRANFYKANLKKAKLNMFYLT